MSTPGPDSNPNAPSPVGVGDVLAAGSPPTREEFEAFVGTNARVYWDLLEPALGTRKLWTGFNMSAALLSTWWLLYRKMYSEFALVFVLMLVASIAYMVVTGRRDLYDPRLVVGDYLVMGMGLGMFGNGLYLRRMHAAVSLARRRSPELAQRLAFIAKSGGTSWRVLAMLGLGRIAFAVGFLLR